jgi:energy-coupling factor transporter ATP-binding protein EcfA2
MAMISSSTTVHLRPSPVISNPPSVPTTPPPPPRIKKISVSGYRAFPPYKPNSLEIDLGDTGKNLLLYGENGSGKTSLFRALRDLFDTSAGTRDYAAVRNIFHQDEDDSVVVALTSGTPDEYRWEVGEPHPKATGDSFHVFARSCLFLEYRDLLKTNFVHHTGAPNLFDLLVNVVLPELPAPTRPLKELHEEMLRARPRPPTRQTKNPIRRADAQAEVLRQALVNHLPELVSTANQLLALLQPRTKLQLVPPEEIAYDKWSQEFEGLTVELRIELNDTVVAEPQHFLNEARLTAIALALYLAAARLTRVGRPGIMVLDDVLIGLDLSNRIPLLQLLQTEFAEWQILLLTHDHVWFDLARAYTERSQNWTCREMFLVEPQAGGLGRPEIRDGADAFARAEAHLAANDLTAAAVYLRAALEGRMRNVCENKGVAVTYKKRPQDVKANDLWAAIKLRQDKRAELQAEQPAKGHHDFISKALIQRVDLIRSNILNRLSHAESPTFERSEVEQARDVVRDLIQHQFPDANR